MPNKTKLPAEAISQEYSFQEVRFHFFSKILAGLSFIRDARFGHIVGDPAFAHNIVRMKQTKRLHAHYISKDEDEYTQKA